MNIRIGTRNSPLAMWQAHKVAEKLNQLGSSYEIVPIHTSGDKNLNKPLYAMGITGIFTKDLDSALLNKKIDIAVHSLKDVPTLLPDSIELIAYLERDFPEDILIRKSSAQQKNISELSIATSSLRRRAFWLNQFPSTMFSDIRGNLQTRLNKLEQGVADATILSLAGLERLGLGVTYEPIPFLLQAPAQGVVCVTGHAENTEVNQLVKLINHQKTEVCVRIERSFLRHLEGGCTAPIGALANYIGEEIHFWGRLCSLDGLIKIETKNRFINPNPEQFGILQAEHILTNGGKDVMMEIKKQMSQ